MSVPIHEGYVPGLLGWCVAEHGRYYAGELGLGAYFERKVAVEMTTLLERSEGSGNHVWWAGDDLPVVTLILDGCDARDGMSHLCWFICSDRSRGTGIGRQLVQGAVEAARVDDASGIYLTTFAGLDAARHLYESSRFVLVEEAADVTWAVPVQEQLFELRF